MAGIIYSYPQADSDSDSEKDLCINGSPRRAKIDSGKLDSDTLAVLQNFLSGKIDQDVAVGQFASEVIRMANEEAKNELESTDEDSLGSSEVDSLEDAIRSLWEIFFAYAIEQPSSHYQLAELIKRLITTPELEQHDATNRSLFRRYSYTLEDEFYEEWRYVTIPEKAGQKREKCLTRWRNINEFAAHLMNSHIKQLKLDIFALWTLKRPLEKITFSKPAKRELEEEIPAAAAFIEIAGEDIFKCDSNFPPYDFKSPGSGGALWHGKHGFCRERWDLWKCQFNEIATLQDVNESTQALAKMAAENMAKIEESSIRLEALK